MLINTVLYDHKDDAELLALSKRGDENAFGMIYNRYFPLLVRIARMKIYSEAHAEDLAQDILISLYRNKEKLALNYSLRAYLIQAVNNKICNVRRKEKVRRHFVEQYVFSSFCENDFAEKMIVREITNKIEKLYAGLPNKCKEVFGLSRRQGLSQQAIAEKLHISTSTVEKHVVKALKVFRKELLS